MVFSVDVVHIPRFSGQSGVPGFLKEGFGLCGPTYYDNPPRVMLGGGGFLWVPEPNPFQEPKESVVILSGHFSGYYDLFVSSGFIVVFTTLLI